MLKKAFHAAVLAALSMLALSIVAAGQTPTFTYQGKLADGASPASGPYDLRFTLFEGDTIESPAAPPVTVDDVQVTNGIFTVQLNFDFTPFRSFAGNYLEIEVRPGASTGAFTKLNPRQPITSSPYAAQSVYSALATNATTADTASNALAVGGTASQFIIREGDLRLQDARAPLPGSSSYIQANLASPQSGASFNIEGSGQLGGNLTVGGTVSGNGSGLTDIAGTLPWQVITGVIQGTSNRGYLIDGSAVTSVNLPLDPAMGDVLKVSTVNPLGLHISQNAGQSIIGSSLAVLPNAWNARETNRSWTGLASSADGTRLVACVQGGQLYTSTDSGVTWTPRESNRSWLSVASSADGTRLIAGDFGSGVYTSTDSGQTWTLRLSGVGNVVSVGSSADGSVLAAVSQNGQIQVSTNGGANWNARETTRFWQSVAVSGNGNVILAGVGSGNIYVSTDRGVNFAARAVSGFWSAVAASFDGSRLVAAPQNSQIQVSSDSGLNWTPVGSNRTWLAIASSADGLSLAAVANTGGNDRVYVSSDGGASWIQRESFRNWRAVASSADGEKLAAAVSGGQIYTSFTGSPIGTTTIGGGGYLKGPQYSAVELQFIGSGRFMIISRQGSLRGY